MKSTSGMNLTFENNKRKFIYVYVYNTRHPIKLFIKVYIKARFTVMYMYTWLTRFFFKESILELLKIVNFCILLCK